jgi:hypothetical protein
MWRAFCDGATDMAQNGHADPAASRRADEARWQARQARDPSLLIRVFSLVKS